MRLADTLARIGQFGALLLIATSAHALATTQFGTGFKEIPGVAWVLTLVLSTLAGIVALLNRIRDELRTNGQLRWMGLFCISHMLGSWLTGLLLFILCVGQGLGESVTAGSVIVGSFMGSVLIEKLAIKWLWRNLGVDVTKPGKLDEPLDRAFVDSSGPSSSAPTPSILRPPERRRRQKKADPAVPLKPAAAEMVREASDFTPLEDSGG